MGFGRHNFLASPPAVDSFGELNAHLLAECLEDDNRRVHGHANTIGEAWEEEKAHLLPLPQRDFQCCVTRSTRVNPYSQVEFETNRYSVPVCGAYKDLVLKAYPFRVDILHQDQVIATHTRCHEKHHDVIEPLHYLPLLEQRPGAFEHAKPMRRWEGSRGIREFLRILKLHQAYPARIVEQAVALAMEYGCVHSDGVQLCLHQLLNPETVAPSLDLTDHPRLAGVGHQPVDLHCYEQLLCEQTLGRG